VAASRAPSAAILCRTRRVPRSQPSSAAPGAARRPAARVAWAVLRARPYALLLLLLGALYLPWIGAIPLDGTLEGNRLEAAREMLRSGDWLVPQLGGTVYLAKPPFHPWTLALVGWPFGEVSLAGGRIVSAACALALCALVFAWGRRELGLRAGVFAAFALGLSALLAEKAVRAELECELALATTLAILAFFEASAAASAARRWSACALSGLALGVAVLVKGPPALIVFLAAASGASLPAARRRACATCATGALALGIGLALLWVVPVCTRLGFERAWSAFHDQFLERIVSAGRTNSEPFWFYVPALLVGLLPATLFAPCLVLTTPGRERASERARVRASFLWGWALVSLVAFSVSSGKETRYLLPTLPAWTLLLARGWTRARAAARFVRWRGVLARSLSIGTWLAPGAWLAGGMLAHPEARAVVALTAAGAWLARAAFEWSARARRPALVVAALALGVLDAKAAWAGTILARARREVPVEAAARSIAARLAPGEEWILLGPYRSWWHFSVDRPCRSARDWSELVQLGAAGAPRYVLAASELVPPEARDFERVERWLVDGESYELLRTLPRGAGLDGASGDVR